MSSRRLVAWGLLFFTALAFRVTLVATVHTDGVTNDGIGYTRLAVRLANGMGYVGGYKPPYYTHFFREPGYPAFLAAGVAIYRALVGPVTLPDSWRSGQNVIDPTMRPVTQLLKYMQAVLDSFNVVLLFALMALMVRVPVAWVIALLYAFYYPSTIACTFLLREVFQTTLVLGMSYCSARFVLGKGRWWIVPSGILLGLSILTLQAMVVLGPVLFVFILVRSRSLKQALIWGGICGLLACVTVSPWIYRTYSHHPDWRVVKSFGSGLTWEWRGYMKAVRKAEYYKTVPKQELRRHKRTLYEDVSTGACLERSFDGYYAEQTRKLDERTPEGIVSARMLKRAARLLVNNSLVNHNWYPNHWHSQRGNHPYYDHIPPEYVAILGLLSVLGIVLWYRRLYPITVSLTAFLVFFYFLTSENRRIIPVSGLLFMFACLALWSLFRTFGDRSLRRDLWGLLKSNPDQESSGGGSR